MYFPNQHSIFSNFNVSVILPFYKKLQDFKRILPLNARYFQRNGIEVIIVMDDPEDEENLVSFIKQYPLINWRVIINRQPHPWRNPAKAINVGIRAATKDYIMVCSPESMFQSDVIFMLRYVAENYQDCFTIGKVAFRSHNTVQNALLESFLLYGSLMVNRKHLEQVSGYSENFEQWGGEDDNLRAKLEYIGLKKILVNEAILVHYEDKTNGHNDRSKQSKSLPLNIKKKAYIPDLNDYQNTIWGTDFSEIIYDYRNNIYAEELCTNYLQQFEHYEICRQDAFTTSHKVIALIHTHNEIVHIQEVLNHLDEICDGIILLDDESTDDTYEVAKSEKLLLKVRVNREGLNELRNKNLLLDVASFIKTDWCFIIDADERLAIYGKSLSSLLDNSIEAYCFYLVHLWDNVNTYRTDVPEKSPIGSAGILHRWRAFKNIGRTQILSDIKFHFKHTPYQTDRKKILPIVIIHYGMLLKEKRHQKYSNYLHHDSTANHKNYKYFLDINVAVKPLDELANILKPFHRII